MQQVPNTGDYVYFPEAGKERVSSVEVVHGAVLVYISKQAGRIGVNWDRLASQQDVLRDLLGDPQERCTHRTELSVLRANT
jgi:hypothetical protein